MLIFFFFVNTNKLMVSTLSLRLRRSPSPWLASTGRSPWPIDTKDQPPALTEDGTKLLGHRDRMSNLHNEHRASALRGNWPRPSVEIWKKFRQIQSHRKQGRRECHRSMVNTITVCKAIRRMRPRTTTGLGRDKFLCALGRTISFQGVMKWIPWGISQFLCTTELKNH